MSNYIKLMPHKKRDRRCDRTVRIVLAARPQLCLSVCRALIEEGGNGDDVLEFVGDDVLEFMGHKIVWSWWCSAQELYEEARRGIETLEIYDDGLFTGRCH